MLKTRKRWISLLVTLAMLVTFILPAGLVFAADDPVRFTGAVKQNVKEEGNQALGWAKVTLTDSEDVGELYLELTLPEGVEFENDATSATLGDYFEFSEGNSGNVELVSADSSSIVVRVYNSISASVYGTFTFITDKGSAVDVSGSAADDIKVNIVAKAIKDGMEVWSYSKEVLVGKQADAKANVTAGTPTSIGVGTKKIADITISESVVEALYGESITFTLPDGFKWINGSWTTSSKYNLSAPISVNADGDELTVGPFTKSAPFAGEFKLKDISIRVFPDAPEGDVEVDVECSDSDLLADTSIVVAKIGESEVTVTSDEDTGDTIYVATMNNKLQDIKFETSGTFSDGDDLILTLPDGLEWNAIYDSTNTIITTEGYTISVQGRFDGNKGLWFTLNDSDFNSTTEFTLSDLAVDVAADAEVGDIELEVSGDFADTSVVVGEVKARLDVIATKPSVTIGFNKTAGDITLTETDDSTVSTVDYIYLSLPAGVTFSKTPTVKVNGKKISGVALFNDNEQAKFKLSGLRSSRPDTILITDISLDLDARVSTGDLVIKIGGPELNALTREVNDTDSEDPIAEIAVATVVSPTASTATLKIGVPTITINGVAKAMEAAPYIKDGRTFIPVRYAANAVGVSDDNIMWDAASKKVTIIKGDRVVQMTIGSNVMTINGAAITMDVAPEITADRTMLPVRFVAQALGANITWDEATQTVTISVN